MLSDLPPNVNKICVHTGNILSLNEVKKKAGQNPTDELIESLKITLSNWEPPKVSDKETVHVCRNNDDLQEKMDAEDRKGLKISVKVFISTLKKETLYNAIDSALEALDMDCIDSLVLAYYPRESDSSMLQQLWQVLEEYVGNGKLTSIGVSDVDTDVFIGLYNWAKVKPSIVQINLASCCVVPPALQAFTKENDVQLLTHSDPFEILPANALNDVFGCTEQSVSLHWALRFQVHVKCRGVLCSKGYILCAQRS